MHQIACTFFKIFPVDDTPDPLLVLGPRIGPLPLFQNPGGAPGCQWCQLIVKTNHPKVSPLQSFAVFDTPIQRLAFDGLVMDFALN